MYAVSGVCLAFGVVVVVVSAFLGVWVVGVVKFTTLTL